MKNFSIISAMDENRGIGYENQLPWHLPADLKHFKEVTMGGTVIMGRKTWDSLPAAYRPLKGRLNIVVSRSQVELPEGTLLAHSLDEALELAQKHGADRKTFVIGGATLYAEAIKHSNCEKLILTEIEGTADCDVFFPTIPAHFKIKTLSDEMEEKGFTFRFVLYRK